MRHVLAPLLLVALPVVAGCRAERTFLITSEPPGALVRLDGEAVGETPVRRDFLYYGTRRVTLRKEGYVTYSEAIELKGPWYARFPVDIFSEVLIPVGWKDRRHLHVDLVAGNEIVAPPELRSVFERADTLRRAGPEGPRDLPPTTARSLPPLGTEVDTPPVTDDERGSDGKGGGDGDR